MNDLSNNQHQQHESGNRIKYREELKGQFEENDSRMTVGERLKNMILLYGPLASMLHIGLSLTFLGITYCLVYYGLDAANILEKYGTIDETYARIISAGGTFGLAYALYKAMMPFRLLVTLFITPKVANQLHRIGLIKKRF